MSRGSVTSWFSDENDGSSQLLDPEEENADFSKDFTFTWKIQNFSLCPHKNGEVFESPVINEARFDGQWIVELYPKGFQKESDGFISLYLRQKNGDKYYQSNDVTFFASIINEKFERIKGGGKRKVFQNKTGEHLGWSQFMQLEELKEYTNNCEDDILRITCTLRCRRSPRRFHTSEVFTEVGVYRNTFLWNVEKPDGSQIRKTEFAFSDSLILQITMLWIKGTLKILMHPKKPTSAFLRCNLSLQGAKGNIIGSKVANHLFEKNDKKEIWDFPSFITAIAVIANKSFLLGNILSLSFEFSVSNGTVSSQVIDDTLVSNDNEDDCLVLQEDIKTMFLNRIHSDVKLKADNEVVHAHKSILSARSPVFFAMFKQDMRESRMGTVDIPDASADTLKSFMEFIYTGKVEMKDYKRVKELLWIANKYQVLSLKEKCVSFLKLELSLLNACEMFVMADLMGHQHLKRVTIDFIAMNSAIMFNTPEWLDLVKQHFKLAKEVFSNIGAHFCLAPTNSSACKTDSWYQERQNKKQKVCNCNLEQHH